MHRRFGALWCALLAAGVLVVTVQAQPNPALKKALDKLTADVAAGKTISDKEIKDFTTKWPDLEDVMKAAYKPLGKKGPSYESFLLKLAKKTSLTAPEKADLVKIANVSRAMALLTPGYDEKTKGNAGKKMKWDKFSKDMGEGSKEVLDAIKAGDDKTIKKAMLKLTASCTDCHADFR
jgi:hypothetical protein